MNVDWNKKYSPNFQAGLTSGIRREIRFSDADKISEFLLKNKGIESNFKNNKIIAWCSLKCVQIIQDANRRFNLNLGFPKGIFVENFNDLRTTKKSSWGFANFAPARVYENNSDIIPERTIFFNNFENPKIWEHIDEIADENYAEGVSPTDFFLETFLHEFMHVIHEGHLMMKLGKQSLFEMLQNIQTPDFVKSFQTHYGSDLKQICNYAVINPMEAVACDLSQRIINNLNKEQLFLTNDFIKSSPYQKSNFLADIYRKIFIKNQTDIILKKCWDGEISKIK